VSETPHVGQLVLDTQESESQIPPVGHSDADTRQAHGCRAVLLVDHGSRRAQANVLLDEVAGLVKQRLGIASIVEIAHMEIAEPTIAQGFARCVEQGATTIVVHPFMLAPGRHVTEDLPRLIAESAEAHGGVAFAVAAPLGSHEGVIDAVIERCRAALPGRAPGER
jgi:sirohydrochlorin ferrochelatase